jgi:hypothetical protein
MAGLLAGEYCFSRVLGEWKRRLDACGLLYRTAFLHPIGPNG